MFDRKPARTGRRAAEGHAPLRATNTRRGERAPACVGTCRPRRPALVVRRVAYTASMHQASDAAESETMTGNVAFRGPRAENAGPTRP